MANKNFEVKNGLSVAGTERISAAGEAALTELTVDDITINGSTISDSSELTIDCGSSIVLDADSGVIDFNDAGTNIGRLENASDNFKLESRVQDKDIILIGNDGGTGVQALRLDMSEAGAALFNTDVTIATAGKRYYVPRASDAAATGSLYSPSGNDIRLSGAGSSSGSLSFEPSSGSGVAMTMNSSGNIGIANTNPSRALLHVGGDGINLNTTLDVSKTAIFRTNQGGNYSTSGNASAAHAATFMRGNDAATGDQVGHSYVFDDGNWSATAEIMAEVESSANAYTQLNFKTWNGSMLTRQVISSSGHIQKPYQPYIRCAGNSASMANNQGTTADFSNWADQVQRGITRSGAVFTVPTAGEYMITYSFYNWMNNTGKGVTHGVFLKKGSTAIQETNAEYDMGDNNYSYYDNNLSNSIILNMNAGDTFKFTVYADIYGGTTHTNMSAYLLG